MLDGRGIGGILREGTDSLQRLLTFTLEPDPCPLRRIGARLLAVEGQHERPNREAVQATVQICRLIVEANQPAERRQRLDLDPVPGCPERSGIRPKSHRPFDFFEVVLILVAQRYALELWLAPL